MYIYMYTSCELFRSATTYINTDPMIDWNKEIIQKMQDTKDIMQATMHSNNQDRHLLFYYC